MSEIAVDYVLGVFRNVLTTAILDRLLHHVHIVHIDGRPIASANWTASYKLQRQLLTGPAPRKENPKPELNGGMRKSSCPPTA